MPTPSHLPIRALSGPDVTETVSVRAHVNRALAHLPLFTAPPAIPGGPLRIIGRRGTPYARIQVHLFTVADALALAEELPAHLLVPPVWDAELPEHDSVTWADGYLRARKHCLPHGGLFIPISQVRLSAVPHPYTTPETQTAFYSGMKAYLGHVWHTMNRARRAAQPSPAHATSAAPAPEVPDMDVNVHTPPSRTSPDSRSLS